MSIEYGIYGMKRMKTQKINLNKYDSRKRRSKGNNDISSKDFPVQWLEGAK